jgi:hypothetical protein
MLGTDTKRLSECFRTEQFLGLERLELLEQLEHLEQAPLVERLEPLKRDSLRCVQSTKLKDIDKDLAVQ